MDKLEAGKKKSPSKNNMQEGIVNFSIYMYLLNSLTLIASEKCMLKNIAEVPTAAAVADDDYDDDVDDDLEYREQLEYITQRFPDIVMSSDPALLKDILASVDGDVDRVVQLLT